MSAVNKLPTRVLRKAARIIDLPRPIQILNDEYITWQCYANLGMVEKGNHYLMDYAILHHPSAVPILEIGTFCGLSTNVITHFKRKHGIGNPLITSDKWEFENVNGRPFIADSPILFSEYKKFVKDSYIQNIQMISTDDMPFTFELTANEFFEDWKNGENCTDVLGRTHNLGGPISFCYIDGNHTYDYAKQYFLHADTYLEDGGLIIFDDSTLTEFSLHKLVPEIMAMSRYRLIAQNPYHLFQKHKSNSLFFYGNGDGAN